MRRRLSIIAIAVGLAAAAMSIGAARADALPTCSNFSLPAPTLGGGIHLEAAATCTGAWNESPWTLQAEVQGNWTSQAHGDWPAAGDGQTCPNYVGEVYFRCFAAGSHHDVTWTATANVQPYCAFNWRMQVVYTTITSGGVANDYRFATPQLNKTC